jgi:hypothetical protein
MRPVVNGSETGVKRISDSELGAVVSVFRRHHGADPAHDWEVVEITIGHDAASKAAPEVEMGVDETGESDAINAVEFLRAGCREIGTYGDQCAVAHVDIATGYLTQFWIHGYQISVSNNELSARRERPRGTICRPEFR